MNSIASIATMTRSNTLSRPLTVRRSSRSVTSKSWKSATDGSRVLLMVPHDGHFAALVVCATSVFPHVEQSNRIAMGVNVTQARRRYKIGGSSQSQLSHHAKAVSELLCEFPG